MKYLVEHRSISNKEAREVIGLKNTATKNLLKEMCGKNLIIVTGKGRGTKYLKY